MSKNFCGLPARLFVTIAATVLVAVPLIVGSLTAIVLAPPVWRTGLAVLLFALLSLVSDMRPVPMDQEGNNEVSIASVFIVTTAVLFGVRYAVPLAALSIAVPAILARQPRERVVFNVSMYAIAAAAAGLPGFLFGPVAGSGLVLSGYALLAGASHLLVNVMLVARVISISREVSYAEVVWPGLRQGGGAFAIMTFLAALAANLWRLDPVLLVLLTGPLFGITSYMTLRSRMAARDAQTDNLTGLGNHRAYQAALLDAVADSRRTSQPFSLCLVDVDDFKDVNDTFGHPVGDEALRRIAVLLRECEDVEAFRFGGDEFAVVAKVDDAGAAEMMGELQRRLVAREICAGWPVTISVGIASYPAHAADGDELHRTADGALYWSKHHGKNRSCLYSPSLVRIYSPQELQRETERSALLHAAKNLVRFVDAKDPSTANHSQMVSTLAEAIAHELGLEEELVDQLRLAGLLHDLGKVGIPDGVLKAPRPLTPKEIEVVRSHPTIGHSLLEGLDLEPIDDWVLHHHEHWDGSGYPGRLAGGEIPLGSRIILVADAYEAITADRPYRRAQSQLAALAELRAQAGRQFDPQVVAALARVLATASAGTPVEAVA